MTFHWHDWQLPTYIQVGSEMNKQCDQIARLFFNTWPLAPMKNCPIPLKNCQSRFKIMPNAKWPFRKLPKTDKIWPKWWIFVKSDHAVWTSQYNSTCFVIWSARKLLFLTRKVGRRCKSGSGSIPQIYFHTNGKKTINSSISKRILYRKTSLLSCILSYCINDENRVAGDGLQGGWSQALVPTGIWNLFIDFNASCLLRWKGLFNLFTTPTWLGKCTTLYVIPFAISNRCISTM